VDEANLKIVQRRSHSKEVTYVPPGRDATVSWGGPDFKFRNNLNKPVLIRIKISGSHLTVYTYTVPGAKVARKKVPQAPESFSTIQVDPNKPTDNLPKTGQ
jgi:vancomycin resistance protein YoaR